MNLTKSWWKEAVAYQIYPRSFFDANGDGVGDLPGVLAKLDYLQSLGVNVVWLCPMYQSPMDDNGFDISESQAIQPEFGSMADFDALLSGLHERGMKLLIDLVVNHTSDEHPWFLESRSSRENPKRDWYLWRDGKEGAEPNNCQSLYGGSAWKYDETTNQYFLHLFSAKQPDLNWENPGIREEIYKMIRWWLDKGVDGFRLDAVSYLKKEPGALEILQGIRKEACAGRNAIMVGEVTGLSAGEAHEWVSDGTEHFNMLFQFEHLGPWNTDSSNRMDLPKIKSALSRWQKGGVWNALAMENHELPRIVSSWGDTGNFWRESATCIATLYFLLRGTPFIYQGQEIGMTNSMFRHFEDFQDVRTKQLFRARRELDWSDDRILAELGPSSRDNARAPMQWTAEKNAGFTAGKPWRPVNENYRRINVEAQEKNPRSILNYYRALAKLRNENPVFLHGEYELLLPEHSQVFAYERSLDGARVAVVCNLSGRETRVDLSGEKLFGNYEGESATYWPFEARVLKRS